MIDFYNMQMFVCYVLSLIFKQFVGLIYFFNFKQHVKSLTHTRPYIILLLTLIPVILTSLIISLLVLMPTFLFKLLNHAPLFIILGMICLLLMRRSLQCLSMLTKILYNIIFLTYILRTILPIQFNLPEIF